MYLRRKLGGRLFCNFVTCSTVTVNQQTSCRQNLNSRSRVVPRDTRLIVRRERIGRGSYHKCLDNLKRTHSIGFIRHTAKSTAFAKDLETSLSSKSRAWSRYDGYIEALSKAFGISVDASAGRSLERAWARRFWSHDAGFSRSGFG